MWVCVIKYLLVSVEWCISKYYLQYLHINDTRYSYIRSDNPEAEADCSWRPGLGRTRTWAAFVRRPGTMSTMSHRGPRHSSTLVTPLRWMSLYSELGLDLAKFCPSDWRWSDKSNWRWYQWMLDLRCQKNLRYLQYNIVNYETTYCIFCLVHKSFRLIKVPDQLIEIRFTWSFIVGRVSGFRKKWQSVFPNQDVWWRDKEGKQRKAMWFDKW